MTSTDRLEAPADLARWGLHAFALGARSTPHRIVAMDDNGPLLFHARHGATFTELAAHGIIPSASQLALLETYGLVAVEGDRVTTAFPVMDPALLADLRPRIKGLAAELAAAVEDEVAAIATALESAGHGGHLYTVVFGHAVDRLLWDELKSAELAPTTELSIERPFWNGVFWAIHPARPGSAGVNELPGAAATLVMVWTDATSAALSELARSPSAADMLADPAGQTVMPVVRTRHTDPVHGSSVRIARTIADAFRPGGAAQPLLDMVPLTGRQEQVVIVAHELIWDLMSALEAAGRITAPAAGGDTVAEAALMRQMLLRVHD